MNNIKLENLIDALEEGELRGESDKSFAQIVAESKAEVLDNQQIITPQTYQ